jgi:Ca2+-binding EF-hand superfamily protein
MFDKKKTGYVKIEDIRFFIDMLHNGQLHSNDEAGLQSLNSLSDSQGTICFRQLKVLHRNFPQLLYPAFRYS